LLVVPEAILAHVVAEEPVASLIASSAPPPYGNGLVGGHGL